MGRMWNRPSHRDPSRPQPEFCALCGTLVAGEDLRTSDVDGLVGARICQTHPMEREHQRNYSFQDMGGTGQAPNIDNSPRYEHGGEGPFGNDDWAS